MPGSMERRASFTALTGRSSSELEQLACSEPTTIGCPFQSLASALSSMNFAHQRGQPE